MPHACRRLALGLLLGLAGPVAAGQVLTEKPAWVTFGYLPDLYGYAVAGAGDLNGDGFDDLAVGAPGPSSASTQPGAVYVFYGGSLSTRVDWMVTGPTEIEGYGADVGAAGDVNGDGYDDLIFSGSFIGTVFVRVYHGSQTGLGFQAAWSQQFSSADTAWPTPARGAGDLNGDGYDDVVVGMRRFSAGASNQGRALVFHGSATGLSSTPVWTVTGAAAGENVGVSVASAGDADGDGYADVLVATATEARLYRGGPAGLGTNPAWSASMQLYFNGLAESYGELAGVGDVDGDGYDDVLVGSAGWSGGQNREGRLQLFRGSAAGLSPAPAWTVESDRDFALLGAAVAGAGDVNGDGYADVIASEDPFYSPGQVLAFLGGPGGLSIAPAWSATGTLDARFGRSVRGAGDVNGDGKDDVIVGAPGWGYPNPEGREVFLYLGEPHAPTSPVAATPIISLYLDTDGTLTLYDFAMSCAGTEIDWEVYEGALGDFTSHVPVLCTTTYSNWATLIPQTGNTYYLVVPRSLDFEGSYGKASSGAERPSSVAACLPQNILACP